MTAITIATVLYVFSGSAAAQTYTLEVSCEPIEGGAYHIDPVQDTYAEGTSITVAVGAKPGFAFIGWEGSISTTDSVMTFEITADTCLTAVFEESDAEPTEFLVLVVSEPQEGGYVTRDVPKVAYEPGEDVTLSAIPATGYVFAYWSGDVPEGAELTSPQLQLSVDQDLEITSNFDAAANVLPDDGTGSSSGSNGSGSLAPCGALGILFWPLTILGMVIARRR